MWAILSLQRGGERKSLRFLSFFGSISSEATPSKFSSFAFKTLSRINCQAIVSWELSASLCSLLHDLTARSYPSGVSPQPQKCLAQTYGPSWAQWLLDQKLTKVSHPVFNEWNHGIARTRESGVGCQRSHIWMIVIYSATFTECFFSANHLFDIGHNGD